MAFEGIDKESQRRRPSSVYRGVTRHRRTGRWEAHIRVKMPEAPRGRQIYLGGFEKEDLAAEACERLLCWDSFAIASLRAAGCMTGMLLIPFR